MLKAATSYRMGNRSIYPMHHMPTELDMQKVAEHIASSGGDIQLGNLLMPYLTGQFPSPPSEIESKPRSYQEKRTTQPFAHHPSPASERATREVEAPFPLSQEEAQMHVDNASNSSGSYGFNAEQTAGKGGRKLDPSYELLSNAARVLQGRIRQNPQLFGFEPQRTQSPGSAGVRSSGLANRMNMYLNTPVTTDVATMAANPVGIMQPIVEGE